MHVLICLHGDEVAFRFDLTTEVLIAEIDEQGRLKGEKEVVLPQASAEVLCRMVLGEKIQVVVCGAIEEEYYQYLKWKRVAILDSVIGGCRAALERLAAGRLRPGDILAGGEDAAP
jgi:hypothetical protein